MTRMRMFFRVRCSCETGRSGEPAPSWARLPAHLPCLRHPYCPLSWDAQRAMTRPLSRPLVRSSLGAAFAVAVSMLWGHAAFALQPVTEFLERAKTWNPQNRAAQATTAQRDAEVAVSTGSLLPNFSATGTYTRNEYEVTTAALIPASAAAGGAAFPNI